MGIKKYILNLEFIRKYLDGKRERFLKSLTAEEIERTEEYGALQKTFGDISQRYGSLERELLKERQNTGEFNQRIIELTNSLGEVSSMYGALEVANLDLRGKLDEEQDRIRKLNLSLETISSQKDAEYAGRIKQLGGEVSKLDGIVKKTLPALENKNRELKETITCQTDNLKSLKLSRDRMAVNLALLRMSRGENPENFSCPESAGIIAMRYENLQEKYATLIEERDSLKRA